MPNLYLNVKSIMGSKTQHARQHVLSGENHLSTLYSSLSS